VELYFFANFALDPERRELRRGSELVDLQPQVFDLLLYLVRNRDRVVSRDDLIASVWGGRIVSDSALASRINAVRKAVGDRGETQTLIRTVPRRGIRFVGTVCVQSDAHDPARGGVLPVNEHRRPPGALPVDTTLPQVKAHRHGWIFAGGLAATMAMVLLVPFALSTRSPTEQVGVEATTAARTTAVAVLPFANLSSDPGQEYFSDGITEEITLALARIPGLHVVARTSAFEFKDQNRNIRAIAEALHATHLIEGSVRKVGDQVRVNVVLIQADSGLQVWSSSYDRQLVNIFAIQEEIARAIAGAMHVPLGLAPGKTLVSNRSIDPDSYLQFLAAKALVHQRRGAGQRSASEGLIEAIELLEPVVARYPGFAPAWGQLALGYQLIPFYAEELEYASVEGRRRTADQWLPKAVAAAERAIALDAGLPEAYAALGHTKAFRGRLLKAEELYSKALALDPFYPEALQGYANLLGAVARTSEALAMKQQLLRMDPFVEAYNGGVRDLLWTSGQTETLIARLKTSSAIDLSYLAQLNSVKGRYADAADALSAIPPDSYPEGMIEAAVRLLRTAPADALSPEPFPRLGDRLDFVYIYVGVPERALERFEDNVAAGLSYPNLVTRLWSPIYSSVRKTDRFKAFARNAGLVEYWHAKGWPEFCRPIGTDDFVCE
jgi:TolB-like protein/DNA-binding winged helix-turn-helix (wHTH) protein/tetratricopeptide (TPR) repeat protein